jgi:hypothetical protein
MDRRPGRLYFRILKIAEPLAGSASVFFLLPARGVMSQLLAESDIAPDIDHLTTEDDAPVDNLPSEKQQRLLTEPLYSSWAGPGDGRPFLAASNVGVFALARNPPLVPDVFLSLDVEVAADWWAKAHRSYFLWEFGKPPDLTLEIVSNREGGEDGEKKRRYAWMRVSYYVIYDPLRQIMPDALTAYRLRDAQYERQADARFPSLGLGLTPWEGVFEGKRATWLRWIDAEGTIVPTGRERAEQERQRAERAESLLEEETRRAERLAELLRQAGIDPGQVR